MGLAPSGYKRAMPKCLKNLGFGITFVQLSQHGFRVYLLIINLYSLGMMAFPEGLASPFGPAVLPNNLERKNEKI